MPRLSKIGAAALAAFGWTGLNTISASYLVVAGGGGAGSFGGGGAGGFLTGTTSLIPTQSYTVLVGAGGAGVVSGPSGGGINGSNGSNSQFGTLTASVGGGGGGGYAAPVAGSAGGSGGGGGYSDPIGSALGGAGTSGQGNAGGSGFIGGAGGGGANAAGSNGGGSGSAGVGGAGGNGTASSISGSSVTYAGGGGGGNGDARTGGSGGAGGTGGGGAGSTGTLTTGAAGTANLGGGGGGGGSGSGTNYGGGGQGGSGVVIISYVGAQQFGGGVVTSSGGSTIHTFNTSGTLSPLSSLTASALVVAGGGGGGASSPNGGGGGGGGAGGFRTSSSLIIDTNSIYTVTVGGGGTAGTTGGSGDGTIGTDSVFSIITSTGGGFGSKADGTGGNGGSGGGGGDAGAATYSGGTGNTPATSPSQGNNGGSTASNAGGGGGGASAVGGNANTATSAGAGGAGSASSITGSSVTYAGGGGGGMNNANAGTAGAAGAGGGGAGGKAAAGTAGTANLGGGGGGGGRESGVQNFNGGAGGSGVVIISYPGSVQQMAGGTVTVAGGNVIHTFTSSGYLAPIFTANNSLRFRSSASAYLNRTLTTPTNNLKWTWSGWVKRGTLSVTNVFFGAGDGSSNNFGSLQFTTSDTLQFAQIDGGSYNVQMVTSAVFRDPSAWYHIQVVYDSANATSTDRVQIYVNGVRQSVTYTTGPFAPNTASKINSAIAHYISKLDYTTIYFDGYLAEVNFVDGQALTPNSFGYYSDLGVWQPIRYGGSYGTNGFYLPFNPGTSTSVGSYNGTTAWFNAANNAAFAFGTGSLTVEAWVYPTQNSYGSIFDTRSTGSGGPGMSIYANSGNGIIFVNNTTYNPSTYLSLNQWSHIAAVRNGASAWTVYINGISVLTFTDASNLTDNACFSGKNYAGTFFFGGAISNLRVVKGTAVYTSNFTLPTSPLTNISGTSLLTLQNSTLIDNSTNAFSLTNTGPVTLGTSYPFSAARIFNDQSPQGNNWTPNNISGVPGATLDYMIDVPTLTSATTANYCVMNPLDAYTNVTLSNANLSATFSAYTGFVRGTFALPSTGQWYWEGTVPTSDVRAEFGIATFSQALGVDPQVAAGCWFYYSNGTNTYKYSAGTATLWGSAWVSGDIIGIAFDASAGTISYYINGALQGGGVATSGLTGTYAPMVGFGNNTSTAISVNFGQRPFVYTPPANHLALNTFNLTTPTIGATAATTANKYFNATTYTGTGSTQNITNSGSMQPDWVWIKNRSSTNSHQLTDSVRGVNLALASDLTIDEFTGNINAFNTNGFQLTGATNAVNASGQTYVAWQWRASNATAVTNTAGSITSTVSASTTAGFSVVTYTGNNTNGATVGHGLLVGGVATAPSMIIIKVRNATARWVVYQKDVITANNEFLELDTTAKVDTSGTNFWTIASINNTTFGLGTNADTNGSTLTFVAYCFAPVAGYSAFGTYTGNGSTDGTFVYTGFRPRFVMVKCSSNTTASTVWVIFDTSRSPYNAAVLELYPDSSASEGTDSSGMDILSNGFKPKRNSEYLNNSGWTYIYMAFAENPFKYANAR